MYLTRCIGPPLLESFKNLLNDHPEKSPETAVELYRDRFAVRGMFENQVYEGIEETLETLVSEGFELYVATSKPQIYAEKIIKHF